eukprot:365115-Chlamydomonas_euryale.AAC.2
MPSSTRRAALISPPDMYAQTHPSRTFCSCVVIMPSSTRSACARSLSDSSAAGSDSTSMSFRTLRRPYASAISSLITPCHAGGENRRHTSKASRAIRVCELVLNDAMSSRRGKRRQASSHRHTGCCSSHSFCPCHVSTSFLVTVGCAHSVGRLSEGAGVAPHTHLAMDTAGRVSRMKHMSSAPHGREYCMEYFPQGANVARPQRPRA